MGKGRGCEGWVMGEGKEVRGRGFTFKHIQGVCVCMCVCVCVCVCVCISSVQHACRRIFMCMHIHMYNK